MVKENLSEMQQDSHAPLLMMNASVFVAGKVANTLKMSTLDAGGSQDSECAQG